MIDYYIGSRNFGIVKRITNDDGSTHHQVLTQDQNNTDYQAYLAWVAEGNTPLPAEEQA